MPATDNVAVRRPKGAVIITDPDRGTIEGDTLQCVHCGLHWVVQRGSGRIRGFCMGCAGPTCGPSCSKTCVPVEQLLCNLEQGNPLDFRPIQAAVPGGIELVGE